MNRDKKENTAGKIHDRANKFQQYVDELNVCLEYVGYSRLSLLDRLRYQNKYGKPPQEPSVSLLKDLRYEVDIQRLSKLTKLDIIQIEIDKDDKTN